MNPGCAPSFFMVSSTSDCTQRSAVYTIRPGPGPQIGDLGRTPSADPTHARRISRRCAAPNTASQG